MKTETNDTPMDYKQFEGHTPGPWARYRLEATRNEHGVYFSPVGRQFVTNELRRDGVLCASAFGRSDSEAEANAILIAAAPDLLKENQELKLELQKQKELNAELVKGLRKARNYVSQGADMFESATDAQHIKEDFQNVVRELESLIKKSSEINP